MSTTQQVAHTHTPGPWNVNGRFVMRCRGEDADGARWEEIAECVTPHDPDEAEARSGEVVANARLISAAPELLEALKLCVERGYFDDEIVPNLTLCRWCRKQKPMHSEFCGVGKAEAAISKAETGQ